MSSVTRHQINNASYNEMKQVLGYDLYPGATHITPEMEDTYRSHITAAYKKSGQYVDNNRQWDNFEYNNNKQLTHYSNTTGTIVGGTTGALVGDILLGPIGLIGGAVGGGLIGNKI